MKGATENEPVLVFIFEAWSCCAAVPSLCLHFPAFPPVTLRPFLFVPLHHHSFPTAQHTESKSFQLAIFVVTAVRQQTDQEQSLRHTILLLPKPLAIVTWGRTLQLSHVGVSEACDWLGQNAKAAAQTKARGSYSLLLTRPADSRMLWAAGQKDTQQVRQAGAKVIGQ